MTGATLRGADPVEAELLAAGRARADHASAHEWADMLAAVDRERRHLEAAAAMLDSSADLAVVIGDRAGARAYRARATSVRAWAAVL